MIFHRLAALGMMAGTGYGLYWLTSTGGWWLLATIPLWLAGLLVCGGLTVALLSQLGR